MNGFLGRATIGAGVALVLALEGCGPGAHEATPPDGATPPVVEAGAGLPPGLDGGAATNADADASAVLPSGTPIQWADQWVAGFYGNTMLQGVNTYSNTDTKGAPDGYYLDFHGDPGVSRFANESDCSSFSDMLLLRAYGAMLPTANVRPLAEDYYWAIRNGKSFTEVTKATDIRAGDTLALLYPPGEMDTGHVAWVDAAPTPFSGPPEEAGLTAYVVTVIDSTNGFHDGPTGPSTQSDDRYLGPALGGSAMCMTDDDCISVYGPNARCNTTQLIGDSVCALSGVGRGHMRVFVDASGTIAGYSWSPDALSTFFPRPNPLPTPAGVFTGADVVVGRYAGP